MFIAHLPAGYLLTRYGQRIVGDSSRAILATGLVASVIPDLDLFWFYLVDDRQVVHHSYVTHMPLFWVGLAGLVWALCRVLKLRKAPLYIGIALAGVLLHMMLDSIAAEVKWFWPFSDYEFGLVVIPASHDWWVWNFILHWTFAAELAIIAGAGAIWMFRRGAPQKRPRT